MKNSPNSTDEESEEAGVETVQERAIELQERYASQRAMRKMQLQEPEKIYGMVSQLSREPFQRMVSDLLGLAPDPNVMMLYFASNPDKWALMVKTFAELAGFSPKLEVSGSVEHTVRQMSDSELLERADEILASANKLIEG